MLMIDNPLRVAGDLWTNLWNVIFSIFNAVAYRNLVSFALFLLKYLSNSVTGRCSTEKGKYVRSPIRNFRLSSILLGSLKFLRCFKFVRQFRTLLNTRPSAVL